jgi:PAS domain S-box-containing protein
MKKDGNNLRPLIQNMILGSVTGIVVGYVIRVYYQYVTGTDIVWIMFFIIGPLIGFLSGRERERIEKLKKEKELLQENLDKVQIAFRRSTNRYRLLIESASDAIFLTTTDGRFIVFNEATCLLSGYKREELKKMNLSDLQADGDDTVKHRKAWLDNGICRYEDKWHTKDGNDIYLEINAKWTQISGYELILHIGRDIIRRKETDEAGKSNEIKGFQTDKIIEAAKIQQIMHDIMTLLNDFPVPEQKERIADSLSQWEKARNFIKEFTAKSSRDLNNKPSQWDLNEIIIQELRYIEKVMDTAGFVVQTSFSPDLSVIWGFGRDYSLIFNTLFRAVIESMASSENKEMTVATHHYSEQNVVEVHFPYVENFESNLIKAVDPLFKRGSWMVEKQKEMGASVLYNFLKSVGGDFEIDSTKGKETVVKIRIPTSQSRKGEVKNQKLEKDQESSVAA